MTWSDSYILKKILSQLKAWFNKYDFLFFLNEKINILKKKDFNFFLKLFFVDWQKMKKECLKSWKNFEIILKWTKYVLWSYELWCFISYYEEGFFSEYSHNFMIITIMLYFLIFFVTILYHLGVFIRFVQ